VLGHADGLEGVRAAYAGFQGIPGVFVHGSNDYFGPQAKNPLKYFLGPSSKRKPPTAARLDTPALTAFFRDLGWVDLDNRAAAMEVRGTHLEFFGVNDPHIRYDRVEAIPGALDELRENDPFSDDNTWPDQGPRSERQAVTIGVTHSPYRRVLDASNGHPDRPSLAPVAPPLSTNARRMPSRQEPQPWTVSSRISVSPALPHCRRASARPAPAR